MFFMHKIEHEWYDTIIGQYDINMTYIDFIMSYCDLGHLAKVSQNQKTFDFGKYFYLNLPDLKNYLFWSHRTDSKGKTNLHVNNAYFAILSQNQIYLEKCLHLSKIHNISTRYLQDIHNICCRLRVMQIVGGAVFSSKKDEDKNCFFLRKSRK